MPIIEKLVWDSNFFELNVGKYINNENNSFNPILFIEEAKHNFDLVYVFSYQKMISSKLVSEANLDLVDIMLTMSKPLTKVDSSENTFDIRTNLSKNEINGCYEIAEQTSVVSRFYNEPLIGLEKAKALYRKWIDNSLNNSMGDGIFITKSNEIVTGIHVIKTDHNDKTGYCSLIGVNNDFKGLGIGKSLWEQANSFWTLQKDIVRCKVPFSIKNTDSFNFHLKMGFNKIEEIKYIYHYRNNNN
jgi:ribosomal protein S18 acetylase RimI-like enzyme